MAAAYSLIVRCRESDVNEHKRALKALGLKWDKNAFYGCVRYGKYKKIAHYCDKNGLKFKIDTGYLCRSGNYRSMFFKFHAPQIGNKYICSYCGKFLSPEKVTVDHLYPVKKVRDDPKLQKKFRKMGIHDVNDPANLVAACKKCNAKKAAKTGRWIFYGKIGQSTTLWLIRKFLRMCLLMAAVYALYRTGVLADVLQAISSNLS